MIEQVCAARGSVAVILRAFSQRCADPLRRDLFIEAREAENGAICLKLCTRKIDLIDS